jgi:hypothetical protein
LNRFHKIYCTGYFSYVQSEKQEIVVKIIVFMDANFLTRDFFHQKDKYTHIDWQNQVFP